MLNTKAIGDDNLYNFNLILNEGNDVGAFDFKSVMLYPPRAFSISEQPSMVRRDAPDNVDWGIATGTLGGSTTTLSDGDIQGVEVMYPLPAIQ
jgi:hypothetical protein